MNRIAYHIVKTFRQGTITYHFYLSVLICAVLSHVYTTIDAWWVSRKLQFSSGKEDEKLGAVDVMYCCLLRSLSSFFTLDNFNESRARVSQLSSLYNFQENFVGISSFRNLMRSYSNSELQLNKFPGDFKISTIRSTIFQKIFLCKMYSQYECASKGRFIPK